jgi:hypothetical protein
LRQTQYGLLYTPFLSGSAEVLATAGRLDDSLAAADEKLRRTERSDGFWRIPEALRIKGEAPLLSDKADTTAAEDHFRRSLDLARRQGRPWRLALPHARRGSTRHFARAKRRHRPDRSVAAISGRIEGRARLGADHPAVRFRSIAKLPGS